MKISNGEEPNQNLRQALEDLETFSNQVEKEPLPCLAHLEIQEGKLIALPSTSLKKTISLAYNNIITPSFQPASEVVGRLLHSSDIIRNYLPLIQGMEEEGSPEQKKFAAYAKAAIERFNRAVEGAASPNRNWQQRIQCFFYQKSGLLIGNRLVKIEIPQKAQIHIDFAPQMPSSCVKPIKARGNNRKADPSSPAAQKISNLRQMMLPQFQLQRQTLELYYMKAIALIERHKLLPNNEARAITRSTPYTYKLDTQSDSLTICQKLCPIPGHQIDLSATFGLDLHAQTFTIFLSDHLSLEASQTGFPHPLQHHGWALSEALIPKCLHRLNRLCHFPALFHNKQQAAKNLLPNGSLTSKACRLLRLKSQTFEQNQAEFLDLQKNLALAITGAALSNQPSSDITTSIVHFFACLASQKAPYSKLAACHAELMDECIQDPLSTLEENWLSQAILTEESARSLLEKNMQMSQDAYREKIKIAKSSQAEFELGSLEYQAVMSRLLRPAIHELILQQYSEIIGYAPPQLSCFAKKLQSALYFQQWEFLHELSLDPDETDYFRRLSRLLEDETTLFKACDLSSFPSQATKITEELNEYYLNRYTE